MSDRNSIIDKLKEARKETPGIEAIPCEECQSPVGAEVQRITEKYCPDCYLEIKFGIIPKARGRY